MYKQRGTTEAGRRAVALFRREIVPTLVGLLVLHATLASIPASAQSPAINLDASFRAVPAQPSHGQPPREARLREQRHQEGLRTHNHPIVANRAA